MHARIYSEIMPRLTSQLPALEDVSSNTLTSPRV